jgi:hypothetical protein
MLASAWAETAGLLKVNECNGDFSPLRTRGSSLVAMIFAKMVTFYSGIETFTSFFVLSQCSSGARQVGQRNVFSLYSAVSS